MFLYREVLLEEATKCALPWLTAWCLYDKYDGSLDDSQILCLGFQRGSDTLLGVSVRGGNDTAVCHNLLVLLG